MNFFSKGKKLKSHSKRASRFAGTWYKNDPAALRLEIEANLEQAQIDSAGHLKDTDNTHLQAIISPHAGFMYSGKTAAFSFCKVATSKNEIKRLFLLGPSHYVNLNGIALCSFDAYQTPLGDIPLERKTIEYLSGSNHFQIDDNIHEREHSLELQTPYIRHVLGEIPMIPLVVGSFSDESHIRSCSKQISDILQPGDFFVVSSDFTHFGPRYDYVPFYNDIKANIEKLDIKAFSLIENLDLKEFIQFQKETDCTICGFNPICLLLATLPKHSKGELLHYETSRDSAKLEDELNSVSYLAIAFNGNAYSNSLDESDKQTLLRLARFTAEFFCETQRKPSLDQLPEDIILSDNVKKDMGVFVTLFLKNAAPQEENLRGCIGYIMPMMPLYQAVIDNAVGACSKDHRFNPVHKNELANIRIEISVLTKPVSVSSYREIEIGKHGILLHCQGRQSVFLPHVATEYGWTLEETLNQLALKAGLKADAWRKSARFEIFESVMFEEEH